jgi:Ca2+-binding RTX toxin-like protein
MATVTYSWQQIADPFFVNTNPELTGDQANPAITALEDGSGYFTAWDQPSLDLLDGRLLQIGGPPESYEFPLNSTATNDQYDPSLATLTNGNAVVTFTDTSVDAGGDIRARVFTAAGTAVDLDFGLSTDSFDDSDSDVATLGQYGSWFPPDRGFVATWTRDLGNGNNDLCAQMFKSDGTPRGDLILVDSDSGLNTHSSEVVEGVNGDFAVVWVQEPIGGGASSVQLRLFNSDGKALTDAIPVDDLLSTSDDIQIVALQDNGFAVAYTDDGWGTGTDITVRIYNYDGTPRTTYLRANDVANGGTTTGDQVNSTLAVLSNGYIVVGWNDGGNLVYQVYDPQGNAIWHNVAVGSSVTEAEIAGFDGGLLANVQSSSVSDDSGGSILSSIHALVRTTKGDGSTETLAGDGLRDVMFGLGGNDTLSGGGGDDTLTGGTGNDRLNGGSGLDTVSYVAALGAVQVDLTLTSAQNAGAGADTLISIEGIVGSDFNDTLKGNARANDIVGGDGDDVIVGLGGNDTLNGGAGNDSVSYASAASAVRVNLGVSSAQNTGGAGSDTLTDVESVIGSAFNDVLTGNGLNNYLNGRDRADRLYGAGGADTLAGGNGNDTMDGGAGRDWASYASAGAGVTLRLSFAGAQDTGGAGIDTLISIQNLIGSNFNDHFTGNSINNYLRGGAGADVLVARGGFDTLDGGAGNDTLDGTQRHESTLATVTYASASSAVTVVLDSQGNGHSSGGAGTDTLISIHQVVGTRFGDTFVGSGFSGGEGNDTLTGGVSDDRLAGDAGADLLRGGSGRDWLEGGAGADRLVGGSGNDTFYYRSLSDSTLSLSGRDLIVDFESGDRIDLHQIDANSTVDGQQMFSLEGTVGNAGDIVVTFDAANNRTLVRLFVNNDATADAVIMLSGEHHLTVDNFVLRDLSGEI